MDAQATDSTQQPTSMTEYAADLARSGVRILPGAAGTYWSAYESYAMIRLPTFHLTPPTAQEVQQILWRGRAAMATYLLEPDEHHPANAWLYLCTDQTYSLEKLPPARRQNVRRGLKELTIAPLTAEQLSVHSVQAFCDTRRRVGLSDGTPEEFQHYLTGHASLPEFVFLGAWKENQLAAYLSIIEVDDWVEIEGTFSMDTLRQYKPNDTLIYSALRHYLTERRCRLVCNGLSSIEAESNAAGLHVFKTKIGFEARSVHRAFVPHPLLRPFVNPLTLWSVNTLLHFRPTDRRLRKAAGVLASMRGDTHMLDVAARNPRGE
ncbi:MAG: hypothetical protein NVS4B12_21770 [Ktedonobacteraceae bacterium]